MSKRAAPPDSPPASGSGGPPPAKKSVTQFAPIQLGPIASLEEMDMKVLQFQNKKLVERIEHRKKAEEELRKRIEQLEQRQTTDDAVLCIVNRYWNQFDEDVRVLLERFDTETITEEDEGPSESITSFLNQLSSWDKSEIDLRLHQRVDFSMRAMGKILQCYDRLQQRHEKLIKSIKVTEEKVDGEITPPPTVKEGDKEDDKKDDGDEAEKKDDDEKEEEEKRPETPSIGEVTKQEIMTLTEENRRLQNLCNQLHEKHHNTSLEFSELQEKFNAAETAVAELRNQVEDLEYEYEKTASRNDKLHMHLSEATEKLKGLKESKTMIVEGGSGKAIEGVPKNKFEELVTELEEQKDLAQNRLTELETLNKNYQEAKKEIEKLRMDISQLPESVIVETTEYKCLQSQFSVLYNESMQIKTQLEEGKTLMATSKNTHLRQIEQMESDELQCQKRLRTEVIQLEDMLAQVRKEYEMLRIEFEQTIAANEQTTTINREMRNLITSLQNEHQLIKGEMSRYKKKIKDNNAEISKLKSEDCPPIKVEPREIKKEPEEIKEEKPIKLSPPHIEEEPPIIIKKEKEEEERTEEKEREKGKSESEIIKDLKTQLKKSQDSAKEMKLLLDMYKSAPKEQRDKVSLMTAEKKCKQEMDELKSHIRKMQEAEKKERRKLADDDAIRKIKKLEDHIFELQKTVTNQKQEEEALLNEIEVTGQAFEDMQEQNVRLLQQLREKDDANFKLMSERIKSNQIQKLLKEEKDVLGEQVHTIQCQVEAQNQVVRKLEEKERILQSNMATVEKELALRQQSAEMHKRKAVETSQSASDLRLHLDKYTSQLKEAQDAVATKTAAIEQESFKYKRIGEEVAILRRKLERAKKIEQAGTADEILMEEIKEYKEQLTCPSCKVKRKDAVLTKCFHVFCLECLKTRYETRQRKCPKCNAGFGANDYHRIYIS
ncbi:unnamed protein product [Owenia fusiformis]|uniref:E3 ubiquitin protein ligase n=1 Tax=Owenia fusiformis TaxID=6347 RepID=A0A8J1TM21_OWEFU|nr:unnamed protein product [Owenia fusiformis]